MLISEQLQEMEGFSPAEQAAAKTILTLEEKIETLTVRELAHQAHTATSAISRLAGKLGYDGFASFKKAYLEETSYLNRHFTKIDANRPFGPDDNLARVANSVGSLYGETAQDTLALVDYQELIRAIDQLEKSTTIYVLCFGVGQDLAKVFADRMMRLGKRTIVSDNINHQFYQTYNSSNDDCFILITYTGTTPKIKTYLKNINRAHAKSILLTSVGEKELSPHANTVLRMSTRERLYSNIANYTTVISTMLWLDLLYSGYFHRNYNTNFTRKRQLAKTYEDCRTSTSAVMAEE